MSITFTIAVLTEIEHDLRIQSETVANHIKQDLVEYISTDQISFMIQEVVETLADTNPEQTVIDALTDALIATMILEEALDGDQPANTIAMKAAARNIEIPLSVASDLLKDTIIELIKKENGEKYLYTESFLSSIINGENE